MFNANGYLDPGLHRMTLPDVELNFVAAFPHSTTRPTILLGYKAHLSELQSLVPGFEQLIDGSFTSNKADPGDIDLVVFVDGDQIDRLSSDQQAKFLDLVSNKLTKSRYLCDAYFCPTYPATHPKFDASRLQRKYWIGEFGYDRSDIPKGIVHIVEGAKGASGSTVAGGSAP